MTREEAIRCLSIHSSTNGSGLCSDKQHYEAKQMAIQALSLEPFINKPCVSSGVCEYDKNKVLDKIRAEIAQSWDGYLVVDKDKDYASNTFKGQPAITTNHVFEIIDKYRG